MGDNSQMVLSSDESFDNVRYIMTSSIRTKLLISLYLSKKRLAVLRDDLEKSSATILHGLKELEKLKLVNKFDKYYYLSSNGYLITLNLLKLIENWLSIDSNLNFWKNHDITAIPSKFLRRGSVLKEAECVVANNQDLSKPLKKYLEIISNSKDLKIVLPIFSKVHLDAIIDSVDSNNSNLDLIITNNILKSIDNNGYSEKLFSNGKSENIKIWKIEDDLNLFMTCCENFLSLILFFEDGYYDDSHMLLDKTEDSIIWGLNIFDYYKEKGKRVDISEI